MKLHNIGNFISIKTTMQTNKITIEEAMSTIDKLKKKIHRLQNYRRKNKIQPEWRSMWYKCKVVQSLVIDYMQYIDPKDDYKASPSIKEVMLSDFWWRIASLDREEEDEDCE
jgi:hypothetical protein